MQKIHPQNVADRAEAMGDAWQAYNDAVDLSSNRAMTEQMGLAAQWVGDQYSASYGEWQDNYSAWTRDQWPVRTESEADKFAAEFDFEKIVDVEF